MLITLYKRRTALSLAWYEWFSYKGKEWKIYCCELALLSEPQVWKFHVVVWQTTLNIATKSVPHVQHDYFSPFNQSNHWFVALSFKLPSSNLKLPDVYSEYGYSLVLITCCRDLNGNRGSQICLISWKYLMHFKTPRNLFKVLQFSGAVLVAFQETGASETRI